MRRELLWKYTAFTLIIAILLVSGCTKEKKEDVKGQNEEVKLEEKNPPQVKDKATVPEEMVVTEVPEYTYQDLREQIKELGVGYPVIEVSTIGDSVSGRNLYLLKLGKGQKKINVVGGVHGREGITSLLVMRLLEDYARHYQLGKEIGAYNLPELLNQVQFQFIPMLNPDGVEIATNGIAAFGRRGFYLEANEGSSDFSRWKANANGVDLNKQFQADWQQENSVGKPHFSDYKGPGPESEPESKALAELTRSEEFASVVVFHNSGSVIFWYYKQDGERYKRDLRLAERLSTVTGYDLIPPKDSDLGAGGYKDWFVDEFKRPGFTIEIGEGAAEKPLPSAQLDRYLAENRGVLLELAHALVE